MRRNNYYRTKKVIVDGIQFDSKAEAQWYEILKALEEAHIIHDLKLQVKYELIPSQRDPETNKVIERPLTYSSDFDFITDWDNKFHCWDIKGFSTDKFLIKKKLMLYLKGIKVEVIKE